jgi:hypothetical protein
MPDETAFAFPAGVNTALNNITNTNAIDSGRERTPSM